MSGPKYIPVPRRGAMPAIGIDQIKPGNSLMVSPGNYGTFSTLQAAYDWLASSDRDGVMGAASATNRRTLVLSPGTYTVTSTLTLSTSYIDIVGLSGNPYDVIIIRTADGGPTVQQTAGVVYLGYLTIKHGTGGTGASTNHGFDMAASNAGSEYEHVHFRHSSPGGGTLNVPCPHRISANDYGVYTHCEHDDYSMRCAESTGFYGLIENCKFGYRSLVGDAENVVFDGTMRYCVAGNELLGCSNWSCDIGPNAIIEYNTAGNNSFCMGKTIYGIVRNNVAGSTSFAGYSGDNTNFPKIAGNAVVENNIALGGCSFAMGHASCVQSGTIINNRNGTTGEYVYGIVSDYVSSITDESASATLTTEFAVAHSNLIFTSVQKGDFGNNITIKYWNTMPANTITVSLSSPPLRQIIIKVGITPSITAAQIKTLIEGNATAAALVTVAYADGEDGSGIPIAMSATALSGGVNRPYLNNNHPYTPIVCTSATTVRLFSNGATYTNTGASGSVTFTLPTPLIGYKYKFVVTAAQAVVIEPGDAAIQKALNTATSSAGDYITSSTVGDWIEIECFDGTSWTCVGASQAWTEE